ncbi:MAG TPA: cysteine rich repeat-containing protein [Thermodesulfovibrionales bacterium]|nr:cysteine rich repeat-containing protein [Thermodesulfovibrionales bacterium]
MGTMLRSCGVAVVLCAFLFSVNAFAQGNGGGGPCAQDVQKFCPGVEPGGGRIMKCLHEHAGEVSDACKARLQQGKDQVKDKLQSCKDDAQKFCKGIQPGGGRIMECLKSHQSELSPACQTTINSTHQHGQRQ